jgi:hypothetical protein
MLSQQDLEKKFGQEIVRQLPFGAPKQRVLQNQFTFPQKYHRMIREKFEVLLKQGKLPKDWTYDCGGSTINRVLR